MAIKEKKLTKNIIIRCTPEQHEQIFATAKACRQTASKYLLSLALEPQSFKGVDHHELIEAILKVKADLARLGNLYKLGLNKQVNVQDTQLALKEQIQLMHRLTTLLEDLHDLKN